MLVKIRMEIEGNKPKTVYRRLYDVEVHGVHARKCKPTHKACIRYNRQDIVVYLIDGEWVSYGEEKGIERRIEC